MAVPLTVNVPDDLMQQFEVLAGQQFRTPAQQALWLIKLAVDAAAKTGTDTAPGKREQRVAAMQPLLAELRSLWLQRGGPASRVVARTIYEKTAVKISHTTVTLMMNGTGAPTWPTLERVVKALDGDVEHFRRLWAAANPARSAQDLR
jgi:hypothetical protein